MAESKNGVEVLLVHPLGLLPDADPSGVGDGPHDAATTVRTAKARTRRTGA